MGPCVAERDPQFMKTAYKNDKAYLSQVDTLDKIERNFNLDIYLPEMQKKVQKILKKNYSKQVLKIAKTSLAAPLGGHNRASLHQSQLVLPKKKGLS